MGQVRQVGKAAGGEDKWAGSVCVGEHFPPGGGAAEEGKKYQEADRPGTGS